MFRILIIDDNENQYENVKSYLLQTQNCNKELKEKILKDFIQIEYIKSPTEAEAYITAAQGTRHEPHLIFCDVNFEGSKNPKDNGRTRGFKLAAFINKKLPNTPIFIITFYGIDEVWSEMTKIIPNHRWIYPISKEGVEQNLQASFNKMLCDIVSDNTDKLKISEANNRIIAERIANNRIEELLRDKDFLVEFKGRNWQLRYLLLGWLHFSPSSDIEKPYNITATKELKSQLKGFIGANNDELRVRFEVLKTAYQNHALHTDFVKEIQEDVQKAVEDFLKVDWQSRNVDDYKYPTYERLNTYFRVGQSLDMLRIGEYDMSNKNTPFLLVNWLKSRLFVLTLHKLICKNKDFFQKERHYSDFQLRYIADFVILAALKNDLNRFFIHEQNQTVTGQVKQYFYTYLRFTGNLLHNQNTDVLPHDFIADDELMIEEIDWLRNVQTNFEDCLK